MSSDRTPSPIIPEAKPAGAVERRAAYVIRALSSLVGTHSQVDCPELSPELTDSVLEAARPERREDYRRLDLWSFVESKSLPGIAVVDERFTGQRLPLCRPIHVQFEPIPLDESHPNLSVLAQLSAGDQFTVPQSRLLAPFRHIAFQAAMTIPGIVFIIRQMIEIATRGFHPPDDLIILFLAAILLGMPVGLFWMTPWFVVPGGVVVRSAWWQRARRLPRRYTPSDAMLFVTEKSGRWNVRICDAKCVLQKRGLSRMECIALLGAWQSPLPPPEMNKLVDLQ